MSSQGLRARPQSAVQFVHTPTWPTLLAAATVLGSLLLGLAEAFGGQAANLVVSAAGYVLGSLATSAFVVLHRLRKQRAARELWFAPRPGLDRVAHALLLAGLTCGAWNAFELATEIAKR